MTEFKVGDRVVVEAPNYPEWNGRGTVINLHDGDPKVRFDRVRLPVGTFRPEDVRLVDPPFDPDITIPAVKLDITRRAHCARIARDILGDAADVYDVVTLAEFLNGHEAPSISAAMDVAGRNMSAGLIVGLGEGARSFLPSAGDPEPFRYKITDSDGVPMTVDGYVVTGIGAHAVVIRAGGGDLVGLTKGDAIDLRDKLTGLLG
ncbi:hypothetical protein OG474_09835 [Kribbella sp. NBC_01505]|uniref:hypothetical protein n=1 Tax=Kribbella sp. NBC_01505 TaxID=2903580 RepID=UPI00386E0A08